MFRRSVVVIGVVCFVCMMVFSGCPVHAAEPGTDTIPPSSSDPLEPVRNPPAALLQPPASKEEPDGPSVIFSKKFFVLSGGDPVVVDPLEYGYHYFSPDETYSLSIDSEYPVNILVMDSIYAGLLPIQVPEYGPTPCRAPDRTVSYSSGFLYEYPLVVQEENIIKKTVVFSVPRTGKYLVIIDPRFNGKTTLDMYGVSTSHEYFRTTMTLHSFPPGTAVAQNKGVVNEILGLTSSFLEMTQVYAFDELGYPLLSPGDIVHLSVVTDKPVNILVLDGEAMGVFSRDTPAEVIVQNRSVDAVHRGYSYWGISPNNGEVFHEDMSFDCEAFVTIPKRSKYYVVIDPRFSYELSSVGGYPISYSADFINTKTYIEVLREDSALYWKKVGDYSLRKGDYKAAEMYYEKSLSLDPENPDTWYNMGIALRDLGKYREAIHAFTQTLRIQPGDADVWEKLGVLYLLIENEAAARDAYNRSFIT